MEISKDLIKALQCLAHQYGDGNCHMDTYNAFKHKEAPEMVCNLCGDTTGKYIECPYHQDTYDTCFEDGAAAECLEDAVKMLERFLGVV